MFSECCGFWDLRAFWAPGQSTARTKHGNKMTIFFSPSPPPTKTSIRRTAPLHPMTTATPQITTVSAGLYSEITIRAHIQRVQVRVQDPSDDLDRRNDNRKEEALCKIYRGLSVSEGLWVLRRLFLKMGFTRQGSGTFARSQCLSWARCPVPRTKRLRLQHRTRRTHLLQSERPEALEVPV